MDAPLSATEYWSSKQVVSDFIERNQQSLPYEDALIRDAIRRATSTGPVGRVHIIGVGGGRELPSVRTATSQACIHAWDISQPMVDRCRAFVAATGLEHVEVGCADVVDLRPLKGPAGLVVAINAVCSYFTTPLQRERSAAAMAGLLRPGGAVAVVVQQRNGRLDWAIWFWLRSLATRLGVAPGLPGDRRNGRDGTSLMVHHYTASELRRMFERAGFIEVRTESLRRWGRRAGHRVPRRSPNPLLLTAVLGERADEHVTTPTAPVR